MLWCKVLNFKEDEIKLYSIETRMLRITCNRTLKDGIRNKTICEMAGGEDREILKIVLYECLAAKPRLVKNKLGTQMTKLIVNNPETNRS